MFTVGIGAGAQSRIQNFGILWKQELAEMRTQAKMRWLAGNILPNPSAKEKSVAPISIEQAKESINDELSVLLYELTAEYDAWEFRCEGTCVAMAG